MNLKLKNLILLLIAAFFILGCGHHGGAEGKLVFKGQVSSVKYDLVNGVTILTDAEGKTTTLEGHPGVPCAEVEIIQVGDHEYEIFQAPRSS